MSKSELVGVGGWLKFLCVSLVFLTPAAILYGDAHAHAALAGHWSRLQPRFQMAFGALVLIDCLRIIFSILSGMALWRREKYAVKLTELYLLFTFSSCPGVRRPTAAQSLETVASLRSGMGFAPCSWTLILGALFGALAKSEEYIRGSSR